jgi:hypothetical protein
MDAISTFGRSNMDVLVLEDFLLERNGIPACWETFSRAASHKAKDYIVYTML